VLTQFVDDSFDVSHQNRLQMIATTVEETKASSSTRTSLLIVVEISRAASSAGISMLALQLPLPPTVAA